MSASMQTEQVIAEERPAEAGALADREGRTASAQPAGGARYRFLIAAGGTGGHVLPGLRVADELRRRGHACTLIGTPRGMETRLAPKAGYPLELIESGRWQGGSWAGRLWTLAGAPWAVLQAARALDRVRPQAVLSLGGYAAAAASAAALAREIPLAILEPNAIPGLTHRLLGPFASRALTAFEEAAGYFPAGRSAVIGMPVREEFFNVPPRRPGRPFTILITGGSQGARRLNEAVIEALERWSAQNVLAQIRFLHQTGEQDFARVLQAYERHGARASVAPFFEDMPHRFAEADLVVCRAGASAVAELCAAGRASILVPYPFAADQHQLRNAEALAKAGGARLVRNQELTGERLAAEVDVCRRSGLEAMEAAARSRARPMAAQDAADCLEELARAAQRRYQHVS